MSFWDGSLAALGVSWALEEKSDSWELEIYFCIALQTTTTLNDLEKPFIITIAHIAVIQTGGSVDGLSSLCDGGGLGRYNSKAESWHWPGTSVPIGSLLVVTAALCTAWQAQQRLWVAMTAHGAKEP